MEHKGMELGDALSLSINAMNATAGKNGLSPCLLVFGITPKIPIEGKEFPDQKQRFKAMHAARSEMVKVTARQRITTSLRRNVPSAADHEISIGSVVLIYKERPRNEWVGPYKVMAGDNNNLLLNVNGRIVPASVDKVKPYKSKPASNSTSPSPSPSEKLDSLLHRIIGGEIFFVRIRAIISKVSE